MIKISELTVNVLQIFLIPCIFSLIILLEKLEKREITKGSFKTFIVSFSLFFILSHILSYLISYLESYWISYLLLFIYLIITQKKNFKIYEIIIYFDFFIIFQAVLYLIISEVRFQLGYNPTDKELDAFAFYLFLSGIFSYLFLFIGWLFAASEQVLEQAKKKF